ncbi:cadherin-related family member 1-like [Haliotis rufescens]|uniref:cadherin-related family member 1-like n=1 Tax=Haliotis rufescens TaxID=6454 RepID=UPI00201F450B|nr:cadherin-related family member 1-like [Haliotis rufescens]
MVGITASRVKDIPMNYILLVAVLYCINGGEANIPPIISVQSTVQVSEDTPPGSFLFNISATDYDTLPVLDIRSAEVSRIVRLEDITVDGNTRHASVVLNNRLDRETDGSTKAVVFFASDGIYEVSARVTLIILDVNDEKPVFTQPGYRVTVKESAAIGTTTTTVTALDPDSGIGGQVYYGLKAKGQNADDYKYTFYVDPRHGHIIQNESLDYKKRTFYQYDVQAWDADPDESHGVNHADQVDFFVTVQDVQDTPPVFTNLPYIRQVYENATLGTSVLLVQAFDGDIGVPNDLNYWIVHDNAAYTDNFTMNNDSGLIKTALPLDTDSDDMKQKGGVLSFQVNASEIVTDNQTQGGDTSTVTHVTVTILDVNDNSPEFSSSIINATVLENTPVGVPLSIEGVIEVKDIDMTVDNNMFELSVEQNGSPYMDFDTIPGSGEQVSRTNVMLRVNNTQVLDYEQHDSISFQIVARESRTQEKRSSTVDVLVHIIDTNDNSPVFNDNYNFNISEGASLGEIVGNVAATDSDSGDFGKVFYLMEDANADFNVSKAGGVITVATQLSREKRSSYSLLVMAYDNEADVNGRRSGQTRVEIRLNDVNAPFKKLMVTCDSRDFKVTVPRDMIQQVFPGSSEYDLTLDDPSCRGQVYYDVVMFRSNILGCGMTREETGSDIVYKNKILTQSRGYYGSTTTGPIITRFNSKDISLECHLNRDVSIVGHFRPQHEHELVARGSGNFSMHMDFYRDPSLSYRITSYPIYIGLNQDVYVDVGLESDDSDLKISLQNCVAKPSVNPYDYYNQYYLIRDGCPADQTVAFEYTSSQKHVHFRFRTFEFVRNNRDVYIFCYVRVCNGTDYDQRCRRDCSSLNRQGRDVSDDRKDHDLHIFQGPLTFREKRNADFQVAGRTDRKDSSSVGTVPAIVMVIAAVAMVMAAVVMVIRWKRRNRSHTTGVET